VFEPVRVGLGEPPPNCELRSDDAVETAGAIPMQLGTDVDNAGSYFWRKFHGDISIGSPDIIKNKTLRVGLMDFVVLT
jgi:hypothetical protein